MIIDISTIIPAIAFFLYIIFAIFGFLQYNKDRFYWSFQMYMLLMAVWGFGSFMMHLNSDFLTPLTWNKIMLVGLLSAPFALVHFITDITQTSKDTIHNVFILVGYALIPFLMFLNFSGLIVTDAGFIGNEFYYELGLGLWIAYPIDYIYIFVTLFIIVREMKKGSKTQITKNLFLPFIGVLIMLVGILLNINPLLGKYPLDILAATINAFLLFYSIYKYKLVNYSNITLSMMLITILTIASSIIYYLVLLFVNQFSESMITKDILQIAFLLGITTAIILQPVRNFLTFIVDKVIIPRRHPYQATIKNLSQKLTTIVDLNELGNQVVKSLTQGGLGEWALFIIEKKSENDAKVFTLIANEKCHTKIQIGEDISIQIQNKKSHEILRPSETNSVSILYADVPEEKFLISDELPLADIIIPLVFRNEVAGYIIVGLKELKNIVYTYEREALEILAAQCSLSLKNSLSFEQLRQQGNEIILSNNKLEAIFNGIASPVAMTDIDYTIIEVNNAATVFFGRPRETLIGRKCYRVFFNRSLPCRYCKALDCLHGGGMTETDAEVQDRVYSFQYHNVKVPQNSRMEFIEIIKDITEQKRLQEDLVRTEKMAGIGAMAAGIAHELNNPLAGIAGTAEIILSELDDTSPLREYAEDILTYSMNAADVIKELSVYTRKETETSEDVDIVRVLEFSLRLALRGSDVKDIQIVRNYHALPHFEANESALQQLFLNLIVNAIQAMDGSGVLTLVCREETGYVTISVSDTGSGISPENLNQIFIPFFTTKPPGTGTGLGLSNCYSIVEKMAGRIRVKSELGEGTEFCVLLPLDETGKNTISFKLVEDDNALNDVFYIQRKVLVGEKGYIEESIHRQVDEKAIHIMAYKGIHPVGTVSLMSSEQFWPLPISKYFNIEPIIGDDVSAEIIRLAVLPDMRNSVVSIGLIVLVFLYARSIGVETVVIDVFKDDLKTKKLYKKFGFIEVGEYYSPAAVTVMILNNKTPMEQDAKRLARFVKPLFNRLIPLFNFGDKTENVLKEMKKIVDL